MGLIRVKWGKLYLEVPGGVFIAVLFKAFLVLHFLST